MITKYISLNDRKENKNLVKKYIFYIEILHKIVLTLKASKAARKTNKYLV